MAESSPLQSTNEQQLLQAALQQPFEPAEVPLSSTTSPPPPPPAPAPLSEPTPVEQPPSEPSENDTWQSAYTSQLSEWRAESATARTKAELTRAKWETIRAREAAERQALGQPPESSDGLGDHITTSVAAAEEIISHSLSTSVASLSSLDHVESREAHGNAVQRGRTETGSPSQRWEHISSSPTSSFPSSFPEASVPHSPSPQPALLASTQAPTQPHTQADHNPTYVPPSTLPSIMDNRVATRTRLSLVLSSLAINLLLPFINGVMLGFGEIFAKEVLVGWFGWKKQPGSIAARLGLRR